MTLTRKQAILAGLAAIAGVVLLQAFNSATCYEHDLVSFLMAAGFFLSPALLIATVCLFTANPLRAVGSCLLFAPWLVFAYYTDCIRPYEGGGASMVYVLVLLLGTPCAFLGALITGPVMRLFNLSIKRAG
jgi:hypothetical protein